MPTGVRVVVLDPLLAAEAVPDGRLEPVGQGHHPRRARRRKPMPQNKRHLLFRPFREVGQARARSASAGPHHGKRGHGFPRLDARRELQGRDGRPGSTTHGDNPRFASPACLDGALDHPRRLLGVWRRVRSSGCTRGTAARGCVSWKYPVPTSEPGMWAARARTGAPLRWASYNPLMRCRLPGAAASRAKPPGLPVSWDSAPGRERPPPPRGGRPPHVRGASGGRGVGHRG